jgi:glycosyltransferase involved in cell wall biosynthesis
MRIGLIIYGSLNTMTGGYIYDRQLVEYLHSQGDEVELISLPWSNYGRHLTHNLSCSLYQQLRKASFDVLLQDELNHPSLFWLNQRLRHQACYPIVAIVHHLRSCEDIPTWQKPFSLWIERYYLKTLDGFIFNSQTTNQTVSKLLEQSRPHIVAYPAGDRLQPTLSTEAITKQVLSNGSLRLLFVGNLIARKGLHILLAALSRLRHIDWQLDVVGSMDFEPAYAQFIKHEAEKLHLNPKMTWHNSLSDTELQDRFRHNHLLVIPSSYEGFGIVYLEGMGWGLPAIATTAGAAHEIITHGENGFLVPPDNITLLAEHIENLSQNRQRLLQMSLTALQHYHKHPTWTQSMNKIRNFLQSFI